MNAKTIVALILIIIVVLIIINTIRNESDGDLKAFLTQGIKKKAQIPKYDMKLLYEINKKIQKILNSAGFYDIKYQLQSHPIKSFTKAKKDIHICIQCAQYDIKKLLYIGLHEVAHVMTRTYHNNEEHNDEWWNIFHRLLNAAKDLGYL